jgi:hypothetical protein
MNETSSRRSRGSAGKKSHRAARIRIGGYFADVIRDRKSAPAVFHWVAQKQGSTEILRWGQEYSLEKAQAEAWHFLQRMAGFRSRPWEPTQQPSSEAA